MAQVFTCAIFYQTYLQFSKFMKIVKEISLYPIDGIRTWAALVLKVETEFKGVNPENINLQFSPAIWLSTESEVEEIE